MTESTDFIKDFQKDHQKMLALVNSFKDAAGTKNTAKAKQILDEIETIANAHFAFEETYLYPRLRRLVSQITEGLSGSHETMREFISKARDLLGGNKPDKTDSFFKNLPKLSEFFDTCNSLAFLAGKFNEYDKNDLNARYKECCRLNSREVIKIYETDRA